MVGASCSLSAWPTDKGVELSRLSGIAPTVSDDGLTYTADTTYTGMSSDFFGVYEEMHGSRLSFPRKKRMATRNASNFL